MTNKKYYCPHCYSTYYNQIGTCLKCGNNIASLGMTFEREPPTGNRGGSGDLVGSIVACFALGVHAISTTIELGGYVIKHGKIVIICAMVLACIFLLLPTRFS